MVTASIGLREAGRTFGATTALAGVDLDLGPGVTGLLGRGPLGQRIGPPDIAPQRVVVEMPAGHDDPSARAARRCALAR